MADIIDPQAVKYVNEVIRPLCERQRALKAEISAAKTQWFSGINALFPNSAGDPVQDGREDEGVSRLTGADINSVMGVLIAAADAVNDEIISKPCVQPFRAS